MLRPGGTLAVQSWLKLKKQQPLISSDALCFTDNKRGQPHHVIKSPQNQLDPANNRVFASEARRVYSPKADKTILSQSQVFSIRCPFTPDSLLTSGHSAMGFGWFHVDFWDFDGIFGLESLEVMKLRIKFLGMCYQWEFYTCWNLMLWMCGRNSPTGTFAWKSCGWFVVREPTWERWEVCDPPRIWPKKGKQIVLSPKIK